MGNFCEALGLERIEAPSTKRKKNFKKKSQPKRQFPFRNTGKTYKPHLPIKTKPKVAKKSSKKQNKPIVCYKCRKVGHKSFQCKMEKKINELFAEDSQLKSKLLILLIQENSDQSDEEHNEYYSDLESQNEKEFDHESSPLPTLNVITNKSQKEFLLDLIGQILMEI